MQQTIVDTLDYRALVLVAVVPQVRDLEIARTQGWYRIPFDRAPRQIGVEALAFYQTAAFGAERWAVRYLAQVQGVRIATRRDLLPDEADHARADQRYLCFSLGPVEALPLAVPSKKLRRVSFILTTFGQLMHASDVCELWHAEFDHAERADLWAAGLAGKRLR